MSTEAMRDYRNHKIESVSSNSMLTTSLYNLFQRQLLFIFPVISDCKLK